MKPFFFFHACLFILSSDFCSAKPIYGSDNRHDLYEVSEPLYRQLADSTVILMDKIELSRTSKGWKTSFPSLQKALNVCTSERFSEQPSGGFCSGTLIGPDLVLTAGHCMDEELEETDPCQSNVFVFGYHVNQKGEYPSEFSGEDVVGCKKILFFEREDYGVDIALIQLDRKITGHQPVKVAWNAKTKKDTPLLMIGHPLGLPTKIEDGATIREDTDEGYFIANTDSYARNSGSGVFHRITGELIGVLYSGENDFTAADKNSCSVSKVCKDNECRGEEISKVDAIRTLIP